MKLYSVDRVEDGMVVLVDSGGKSVAVAREKFDCEPREGMTFSHRRGGYVSEDEQEKKQRESNAALLHSLTDRN